MASVRTSEPVAHKPLGVYVSYINHCSLQCSVQTGSEYPAMGRLSLPLHQSSAHPRSPEPRGRHAFEEGDSSRRVEVAPRISLDDLEPLQESGGGSVRHEREGALHTILLPVSLPVERGCAGIALANSQAICVSSDQDIATGVMQDQGGANFRDTHHPEPAEPALFPRPDRTAGGTALADPHQEGFAIPGGRLSVAPEPGVVEPSCVAASGISEGLSALNSRVLDTWWVFLRERRDCIPRARLQSRPGA